MAITNLPQPPERGVDSQSTFVTKAESFFDALKNVFVGEMNTEITNVNNNATSAATSAATATTKASEASASAASALAASNSKGAWSALTGALSIPASVTHNGKIWVLNTNLADVTLSEPTSINTDWTQSGVSQSELDLKAPIASPTFTGNVTLPEITETTYNLTGTALDPANGTIQYKTLSGNTTLTESLADGQYVLLEVTYATFTLTLPTSTAINTLPDGSNTTDFLMFFKRGTTLYVSNLGGVA